MTEQKLSLRTKIGFGIGDIGGNVMFTLMAFAIPTFLTDNLGLMPILAGLAVWIAKVWDAVTDPVMGYISDRTKTKWGRRRPYLLAGGIFAVAAMAIMFSNPRLSTAGPQTGLFIWAIFIYCLLCTAYTMFNVPYAALTPDLTDDFHQQTSLNSWRMGFAVIGTLLAMGAFLPLVSLLNAAGSRDLSQGYFVTGILFGVLIMTVTLVTFFSVREKTPATVPRSSFKEIFASYARVLKNRPFRLVLIPYAVNLIGITLISSTLQIYFKYIYHDLNGASIAGIFLLGMTVVSIVAWNPIIKRIGKNVAYAIGLFTIAGIALLVFFFAPVFGEMFMFVMMAIAGIGMGATYVAPYTMVPDAIEYEQAASGRRQEGAYYGIWTFFSKTGQAMAGLLWGLVLQLMHYIPPVSGQGLHTGVDTQAPEALFGIRLLLGPLPAAFLILAGVIVLFYPINEKIYREFMAKKKG